MFSGQERTYRSDKLREIFERNKIDCMTPDWSENGCWFGVTFVYSNCGVEDSSSCVEILYMDKKWSVIGPNPDNPGGVFNEKYDDFEIAVNFFERCLKYVPDYINHMQTKR